MPGLPRENIIFIWDSKQAHVSEPVEVASKFKYKIELY